MTVQRTTMPDFVATLRRHVPPPELHPVARLHVDAWLAKACIASACGDRCEAVRLLRMVRAKIVDELRWEADKHESAFDFRQAYKLMRRADQLAGVSSDWLGKPSTAKRPGLPPTRPSKNVNCWPAAVTSRLWTNTCRQPHRKSKLAAIMTLQEAGA